MEKVAIIVAGGSGTRMGNELPKQFLKLNGKPLVYYPIDCFLKSFPDMQVVLVLPQGYIDLGQEIIDAYFDKDRIRVTMGGSTRFESVKNGLKLVTGEAMIFVHDAVRCLVTKDLIQRCYEKAMESGSAIPVVSCHDSVRMLNDDGSEILEREKIVIVQTPQVFHSKILIPAYQIDHKDWFTDEASVVEAFGMKVSLVQGEQHNIKITRPFDLQIAEQVLRISAR